MNDYVPPPLEGLYAWALTVESAPLGVAIAESRFAFAIIEGIHLIGLVFAVGLLFLIDLRLMGVLLRGVSVHRVLAQLRPWAIAGFVTIFITGTLLFWSSAGRLVQSPVFPIKLGLIALAGLNALYFELVIARSEAVRQHPWQLPLSARLAGASSLLLWTLVIIAGRLIPYLPTWQTTL
jgi:hypothetical protein